MAFVSEPRRGFRAFSWLFKQEPPGQPAPSPPAEATAGSFVTFDRTNSEMLKQYYRSIYLWRCVDMIAQMSSSIVLDVRPNANRSLNDAEKAVDRLLKFPNPQWPAAALQYFVAASLAVANRAYLLKVKSADRTAGVLKRWPIPANEVTIKTKNGTGIIEAFERTSGVTAKQTYPVDENGDSDMIYIRRPALNSETDKSPATVSQAPAEVFTRILQRCH